jgi:DNA-binding winged helix-turn-helix (wHTH) protein
MELLSNTEQEGPGSQAGPLPETAQSSPPRIYQFGAFNLKTDTGELSKHGVRIKLQIKPLKILIALIEHAGELVTREQLCKILWSEGTFVDYESGLNTATNRLRATLGDSAESPRYIETLPRLGYRFICPVKVISEGRPKPIGEPLKAMAAAATGTVPMEAPATVQPPNVATASNNGTEPELQQTANNGTQESKDYRLAKHERWLVIGAVVAGCLAVVAGAIMLLFQRSSVKTQTKSIQPTFNQLTFRPEAVLNARFSSDGKHVVYTARPKGREPVSYEVNIADKGSQMIPGVTGTLASVSPTGELAWVMNKMSPGGASHKLFRFSGEANQPTLISTDIRGADWIPSSPGEVAAIRRTGGKSSVEFPLGHVVFTSSGWIDCLRVSPRGDTLAFIEHPVRDDDEGYLHVLNKASGKSLRSDLWSSIEGVAWSPRSNDVWFTASKNGAAKTLYSFSRFGVVRQVFNSPSSLRLEDIARDGSVLLSLENSRISLVASFAGEKSEQDISQYDASYVDDISADGKLILLTEGGEAGGRDYRSYTYDRASNKFSLIGPGRALALSPDKKRALLVNPQDRSGLKLISLDGGAITQIPGSGYLYQWAKFMPDGETLLVGGAHSAGALSIDTQKIRGGNPTPVPNAPYLDHTVISHDGLMLAGVDTNARTLLYHFKSRSVRPLAATPALPVAWSQDDVHLYAAQVDQGPPVILQTNVLTGSTAPWKAIGQSEAAGSEGIANVVAAPGSNAYAYSLGWDSSRLCVVEGLS